MCSVKEFNKDKALSLDLQAEQCARRCEMACLLFSLPGVTHLQLAFRTTSVCDVASVGTVSNTPKLLLILSIILYFYKIFIRA